MQAQAQESGTMRFARKKSLDFGLCLLVFTTAVVIRFIYQYHQFDDAFVTFRYCLNLVRGKGFVYNEGERVLGTTTPLFTALLAGVGFILRTERFTLLANVVNHLADGGTAVLLYGIGLRLWRSRALACLLALYFALAYHSIFYSGCGMETEFYSFLLLFALERALRRRLRAAFVLAALALMTRPDALMLLAVLGVYVLLASRKHFRPAQALPALALVGLYAAGLWRYFGHLIPQSMAAKMMMWGTVEHNFTLRLPNWWEVMMFWSGFLSKSHARQDWPNIIRTIPLLALLVLGIVEIARRHRRMLLLPGFGLFFTLAYAKTTIYIFPWYLVPTIPSLVLMVFAAVKLMGEKLSRILRPGMNPVYGAALLCALVLGFESIVFVSARSSIPSAIARAMYPAHTEMLYREALTKIPARTDHFSIMAPELGYIGYYCPQARIIDPVGLTNPEITAYYHRPAVELPRDLHFVNRGVVEEFQPDYIIVLPAFIENDMERQPYFSAHYERVAVPLDPKRFTNPEQVLLYQKRPVGTAGLPKNMAPERPAQRRTKA